MSRDDLAERLRAVPVPDEEGAEARAHAVLEAAFQARAERSPLLTRPSKRLVPALAAAAVLALIVLAVTPPGQAISDWLRDELGRDHVRVTTRPALDRLPGGGSLLVQSPSGAWVVRADGSKRLLGPYRQATWSPFGRFVGVTKADELLAVEPGGRVHWTLPRHDVRDPRWSPSGFRVAYRSGASVRVVAGDGTGDRVVGRGVAAEWRPLTVGVVGGQKVLPSANVLALARRDGSVRAFDVDTRRTLWSTRVARGARSMSWARDGSHLLVATARTVSVLDRAGRVTRRVALPPGTTLTDARFGPDPGTFAMIRRRGSASELALFDGRHTRLLFAGAGRLTGLTWSPDGEWLLVGWPTADQFLFVRPGSPPSVRAAQGVSAEFDPRAAVPNGAPVPAGWCCSG